jgi:hypothetical protein
LLATGRVNIQVGQQNVEIVVSYFVECFRNIGRASHVKTVSLQDKRERCADAVFVVNEAEGAWSRTWLVAPG